VTTAAPSSKPAANGTPVPPVGDLKVFSGRLHTQLTERICNHIGIAPGAARSTLFPDGEILVKLDEDVRGRDCFVVISTCNPVNDNLMELLIFLDCLRRASATRVTVVLPYFGYGRQDRKDEGRVPITAKLVANLITAAKADRVLALDLHAAQIQGFFDLPFDHLTASPVIVNHMRAQRDTLGELCVVSPDVGNVKVAESYANHLHAELAIINKRRLSGSEVVLSNLIGDVRGKTVLLVDAPISQVILTDTIPLGPRLDPIRHKLVELSVGELLGKAIHNIHHNLSVSALFKDTAGVKR
jgi:ribose-phosphate pyrophosphokinase